MHPLLERQLRNAFPHIQVDDEFAGFLRAVDAAYVAADEDRAQLERSLHLTSGELFERNRRLEDELRERKRLELELHLAEKLRAVGQLAAGIAHEINTPVQFISDSLQFLQAAFTDLSVLLSAREQAMDSTIDAALKAKLASQNAQIDLPFLREEVPAALQRCQDGTRRVADIVRALKELSHPGSSEQQPADINKAVRNALIVASNEIKYVADVELQLQDCREIPCNASEIQQVLLNLIVNASHAIAACKDRQGGKGLISIGTRESGDELIITVADNGTGIADSARERIFEPFFTTKPVGKGTGQGLPIAHSLIVERHGGLLSFESTPGKGTTFSIRLPLAGREAGRLAAAA